MRTTRIWDLPTRLFHWMLAALVVALVVSGSIGGNAMVWHFRFGYGVLSLLLFRIVWGLVGSRHARFENFLESPKAAVAYLSSLSRGQPVHHTGHNPAGGWAIIGLLLFGLGTAASGWPLYQDIGGEWLEELHEVLVNAMLLLVAVHLAGVAVGSIAHKENLPRAMLTGYKQGKLEEAISGARLWALPLLLTSAGFCAWLLSR